MKHLIFLISLLTGLLCSYGQNIEKIEYSIDNLVKPGDGITISLTGDENEINTDLDIDISSLESGLHLLYIRTQNTDGVWSLPSQQSFYVVKPDTAKVASLEYRIYQTSGDYDWLSAKIEPERKTVDSTFNLSTDGLQVNESYYIEMYAKNNFDSRGFSVFSNQFTYRENHSPEGKWDTLEVTAYATESLKIEFDTLFVDEDFIYGDSLIYSLMDTGETDILSFSEYIPNQSLTLLPEIADTGSYELKFYAEDIPGDSDSILVSLTVKRINHAPESVREEMTLSLRESDQMKIAMDTLFVDVDIEYGDALSFAVIDTSSVGVSDFSDWLAEDTLLLSPPEGSDGNYIFWVQATDSENANDSIKFLLNVKKQNQAPEKLKESLSLIVVETEELSVLMDTIFTDANIPEGDVLSYTVSTLSSLEIETFTEFSGNVLNISPTVGKAGEYSFWLVASDEENLKDSIEVSLMVQDINHAPEALYGIITKTLDEEETWDIGMDTIFTDTDISNGDMLTYSLANNSNSGGDFANWISDVIQFTPTDGDAGEYNYWIKATDTYNASDSVKIELTITNSVGIISLQAKNRFQVVPNPNSGIFNLKLPDNLLNNFQVFIYTTDGRMVEQIENRTEIIVTDLKTGLYIIKVTDWKNSYTERLMIE